MRPISYTQYYNYIIGNDKVLYNAHVYLHLQRREMYSRTYSQDGLGVAA